MSKGIILFGSAGAGKTTLGRLTAAALNFPYFDLDNYIWRKDSDKPYSVMYTREEKIGRLMQAISAHPHFVMAGSMDSFHDAFDPLFELGVHLTANAALRQVRLRSRERMLLGERILSGGDSYENHLRFLNNAARYDADGSPNRAKHAAWAETMPCPVLSLDGGDPLDVNCARIVQAYSQLAK